MVNTKSTTTSPFDPRTILFLVIMIVLMSLFAGCRSTQASYDSTAESQSSTQAFSFQNMCLLDSVIRHIQFSADSVSLLVTVDIDPSFQLATVPDGSPSVPKSQNLSFKAYNLKHTKESTEVTTTNDKCSRSSLNTYQDTAQESFLKETKKPPWLLISIILTILIFLVGYLTRNHWLRLFKWFICLFSR